MDDAYTSFIESKSQRHTDSGFEPTVMPDWLFPFQRHLVEWAVRKGRAAIFADCGLGKTPMQLVWAQNIVEHTGKPVLILTPLAVSHQTVREAEKFGIEAARSADGALTAPITVTNYERLSHFDPASFAGVVCDECFAAGTRVDVIDPIDNTLAWKYIEDIRPGDQVLNATGVDHVKATHRRQIKRAVRITVGERVVACSDNHPFLTVYGWRCAGDLQPGDNLVETATAVCLVRDGLCPEVHSPKVGAFLRDVLFSEMADEYARAQSEGAYKGCSREDRPEDIRVASGGIARGGGSDRKDSGPEPDVRSGRAGEGVSDVAADWPQALCSGRKRTSDDGAATAVVQRAGRSVGGGVCDQSRAEDERLSDCLQGGHRQSCPPDCDRGRRQLSLFQKGVRPEEGYKTGVTRVDRVEILELGHPDLDRCRDASGDVYFHDIEATRHPSFSVGGLLVHNSSILKNFAGRTKAAVTDFCRHLSYRLLCTATAAPNDFWELGTSSEALGYLGFSDMLAQFFKQETKKDFRAWGRAKYRFRGYAEIPFWQWVCSWARVCRRPSDLGFDDDGFVLPPLREKEYIIKTCKPRAGMLLNLPARDLQEQREERRNTIAERCEKAASITQQNGASVVWCHLNAEGDRLAKLIPDAEQVSGSMSDDLKEERLLAFQSGELKTLVTKPKIGCFGLNWQHCHNVITFPSHSWEQYYQAVRRCWRFGQTKPVDVTLITTEGEQRVLLNLQRKAEQADTMFTSLTQFANDALHVTTTRGDLHDESMPGWLQSRKG